MGRGWVDSDRSLRPALGELWVLPASVQGSHLLRTFAFRSESDSRKLGL